MDIKYIEEKGECQVSLLSAIDNGFTLDKSKFKY
jgi:hypothetical protein